jgi:hypothetical protein
MAFRLIISDSKMLYCVKPQKVELRIDFGKF